MLFKGMANVFGEGFASSFGTGTLEKLGSKWAREDVGIGKKLWSSVYAPTIGNIAGGLEIGSRAAVWGREARKAGVGLAEKEYVTRGYGMAAGRTIKGLGYAWGGMGAVNMFRPGDNIGLF